MTKVEKIELGVFGMVVMLAIGVIVYKLSIKEIRNKFKI
jgi:hypothetical protein